MSSGLSLGEGQRPEFPEYRGRLQPYLLIVPPGRPRPSGLTFSLHSLGGTYTQFAVFSPNQLRQFGESARRPRRHSPRPRPDGWYMDHAEVDFFEVWRDVARRFSLDPGSVALSGYSMGGYGTYRLSTIMPDSFASAVSIVGPPGNGDLALSRTAPWWRGQP
jgi:poly(3-hydroxybutyrate) depolymerase